MRVGLCTGLLLLALTPAGHAGSAPQQEVDLGGPQWSPYTIFPNRYYDVKASIGVDSRGVAHYVRQVYNEQLLSEIHYRNNDFENPGNDGFTKVPFVLGGAGTGWELVEYPDLWVDNEDNVHVVWVHSHRDPDYSVICYRKRTGNAWGRLEFLTQAQSFVKYGMAQIVLDSEGTIHVIAYQYRVGYPRSDHVIHITKTAGGLSWREIPNNIWPNQLRFAAHGTQLAAVWEDASGAQSQCFYSLYNPSDLWSPPVLLDSYVPNGAPDVCWDKSGKLYFSWVRKPVDQAPIVMYRRLNEPAIQVSRAPPAPILEYLDNASRILVDADNMVHVFYPGLCHASRAADGASWDYRQEPVASYVHAMQSIDEVAVGVDGILHVVWNNYYTRTTPGVYPLPAFPGGSVNLMDGGLMCRIDLFEMQGVGPSLSMGVNYNSRSGQHGVDCRAF